MAGKGGRPPKDPGEKMDVLFRIPLTEKMKRAVQEAAKRANLDMAAWARNVLLVEAGLLPRKEPGPPPSRAKNDRSHPSPVFPGNTPVPRGWVTQNEVVAHTGLDEHQVAQLAATGVFRRIIIGRRGWFDLDQVTEVFRSLYGEEPPRLPLDPGWKVEPTGGYADWNPFEDGD
jgi:hypothetical protein